MINDIQERWHILTSHIIFKQIRQYKSELIFNILALGRWLLNLIWDTKCDKNWAQLNVFGLDFFKKIIILI